MSRFAIFITGSRSPRFLRDQSRLAAGQRGNSAREHLTPLGKAEFPLLKERELTK